VSEFTFPWTVTPKVRVPVSLGVVQEFTTVVGRPLPDTLVRLLDQDGDVVTDHNDCFVVLVPQEPLVWRVDLGGSWVSTFVRGTAPFPFVVFRRAGEFTLVLTCRGYALPPRRVLVRVWAKPPVRLHSLGEVNTTVGKDAQIGSVTLRDEDNGLATTCSATITWNVVPSETVTGATPSGDDSEEIVVTSRSSVQVAAASATLPVMRFTRPGVFNLTLTCAVTHPNSAVAPSQLTHVIPVNVAPERRVLQNDFNLFWDVNEITVAAGVDFSERMLVRASCSEGRVSGPLSVNAKDDSRSCHKEFSGSMVDDHSFFSSAVLYQACHYTLDLVMTGAKLPEPIPLRVAHASARKLKILSSANQERRVEHSDSAPWTFKPHEPFTCKVAVLDEYSNVCTGTADLVSLAIAPSHGNSLGDTVCEQTSIDGVATFTIELSDHTATRLVFVLPAAPEAVCYSVLMLSCAPTQLAFSRHTPNPCFFVSDEGRKVWPHPILYVCDDTSQVVSVKSDIPRVVTCHFVPDDTPAQGIGVPPDRVATGVGVDEIELGEAAVVAGVAEFGPLVMPRNCHRNGYFKFSSPGLASATSEPLHVNPPRSFLYCNWLLWFLLALLTLACLALFGHRSYFIGNELHETFPHQCKAFVISSFVVPFCIAVAAACVWLFWARRRGPFTAQSKFGAATKAVSEMRRVLLPAYTIDLTGVRDSHALFCVKESSHIVLRNSHRPSTASEVRAPVVPRPASPSPMALEKGTTVELQSLSHANPPALAPGADSPRPLCDLRLTFGVRGQPDCTTVLVRAGKQVTHLVRLAPGMHTVEVETLEHLEVGEKPVWCATTALSLLVIQPRLPKESTTTQLQTTSLLASGVASLGSVVTVMQTCTPLVGDWLLAALGGVLVDVPVEDIIVNFLGLIALVAAICLAYRLYKQRPPRIKAQAEAPNTVAPVAQCKSELMRLLRQPLMALVRALVLPKDSPWCAVLGDSHTPDAGPAELFSGLRTVALAVCSAVSQSSSAGPAASGSNLVGALNLLFPGLGERLQPVCTSLLSGRDPSQVLEAIGLLAPLEPLSEALQALVGRTLEHAVSLLSGLAPGTRVDEAVLRGRVSVLLQLIRAAGVEDSLVETPLSLVCHLLACDVVRAVLPIVVTARGGGKLSSGQFLAVAQSLLAVAAPEVPAAQVLQALEFGARTTSASVTPSNEVEKSISNGAQVVAQFLQLKARGSAESAELLVVMQAASGVCSSLLPDSKAVKLFSTACEVLEGAPPTLKVTFESDDRSVVISGVPEGGQSADGLRMALTHLAPVLGGVAAQRAGELLEVPAHVSDLLVAVMQALFAMASGDPQAAVQSVIAPSLLAMMVSVRGSGLALPASIATALGEDLHTQSSSLSECLSHQPGVRDALLAFTEWTQWLCDELGRPGLVANDAVRQGFPAVSSLFRVFGAVLERSEEFESGGLHQLAAVADSVADDDAWMATAGLSAAHARLASRLLVPLLRGDWHQLRTSVLAQGSTAVVLDLLPDVIIKELDVDRAAAAELFGVLRLVSELRLAVSGPVRLKHIGREVLLPLLALLATLARRVQGVSDSVWLSRLLDAAVSASSIAQGDSLAGLAPAMLHELRGMLAPDAGGADISPLAEALMKHLAPFISGKPDAASFVRALFGCLPETGERTACFAAALTHAASVQSALSRKGATTATVSALLELLIAVLTELDNRGLGDALSTSLGCDVSSLVEPLAHLGALCVQAPGWDSLWSKLCSSTLAVADSEQAVREALAVLKTVQAHPAVSGSDMLTAAVGAAAVAMSSEIVAAVAPLVLARRRDRALLLDTITKLVPAVMALLVRDHAVKEASATVGFLVHCASQPPQTLLLDPAARAALPVSKQQALAKAENLRLQQLRLFNVPLPEDVRLQVQDVLTLVQFLATLRARRHASMSEVSALLDAACKLCVSLGANFEEARLLTNASALVKRVPSTVVARFPSAGVVHFDGIPESAQPGLEPVKTALLQVVPVLGGALTKRLWQQIGVPDHVHDMVSALSLAVFYTACSDNQAALHCLVAPCLLAMLHVVRNSGPALPPTVTALLGAKLRDRNVALAERLSHKPSLRLALLAFTEYGQWLCEQLGGPDGVANESVRVVMRPVSIVLQVFCAVLERVHDYEPGAGLEHFAAIAGVVVDDDAWLRRAGVASLKHRRALRTLLPALLAGDFGAFGTVTPAAAVSMVLSLLTERGDVELDPQVQNLVEFVLELPVVLRGDAGSPKQWRPPFFLVANVALAILSQVQLQEDSDVPLVSEETNARLSRAILAIAGGPFPLQLVHEAFVWHSVDGDAAALLSPILLAAVSGRKSLTESVVDLLHAVLPVATLDHGTSCASVLRDIEHLVSHAELSRALPGYAARAVAVLNLVLSEIRNVPGFDSVDSVLLPFLEVVRVCLSDPGFRSLVGVILGPRHSSALRDAVINLVPALLSSVLSSQQVDTLRAVLLLAVSTTAPATANATSPSKVGSDLSAEIQELVDEARELAVAATAADSKGHVHELLKRGAANAGRLAAALGLEPHHVVSPLLQAALLAASGNHRNAVQLIVGPSMQVLLGSETAPGVLMRQLELLGQSTQPVVKVLRQLAASSLATVLLPVVLSPDSLDSSSVQTMVAALAPRVLERTLSPSDAVAIIQRLSDVVALCMHSTMSQQDPSSLSTATDSPLKRPADWLAPPAPRAGALPPVGRGEPARGALRGLKPLPVVVRSAATIDRRPTIDVDSLLQNMPETSRQLVLDCIDLLRDVRAMDATRALSPTELLLPLRKAERLFASVEGAMHLKVALTTACGLLEAAPASLVARFDVGGRSLGFEGVSADACKALDKVKEALLQVVPGVALAVAHLLEAPPQVTDLVSMLMQSVFRAVDGAYCEALECLVPVLSDVLAPTVLGLVMPAERVAAVLAVMSLLRHPSAPPAVAIPEELADAVAVTKDIRTLPGAATAQDLVAVIRAARRVCGTLPGSDEANSRLALCLESAQSALEAHCASVSKAAQASPATGRPAPSAPATAVVDDLQLNQAAKAALFEFTPVVCGHIAQKLGNLSLQQTAVARAFVEFTVLIQDGDWCKAVRQLVPPVVPLVVPPSLAAGASECVPLLVDHVASGDLGAAVRLLPLCALRLLAADVLVAVIPPRLALLGVPVSTDDARQLLTVLLSAAEVHSTSVSLPSLTGVDLAALTRVLPSLSPLIVQVLHRQPWLSVELRECALGIAETLCQSHSTTSTALLLRVVPALLGLATECATLPVEVVEGVEMLQRVCRAPITHWIVDDGVVEAVKLAFGEFLGLARRPNGESATPLRCLHGPGLDKPGLSEGDRQMAMCLLRELAHNPSTTLLALLEGAHRQAKVALLRMVKQIAELLLQSLDAAQGVADAEFWRKLLTRLSSIAVQSLLASGDTEQNLRQLCTLTANHVRDCIQQAPLLSDRALLVQSLEECKGATNPAENNPSNVPVPPPPQEHPPTSAVEPSEPDQPATALQRIVYGAVTKCSAAATPDGSPLPSYSTVATALAAVGHAASEQVEHFVIASVVRRLARSEAGGTADHAGPFRDLQDQLFDMLGPLLRGPEWARNAATQARAGLLSAMEFVSAPLTYLASSLVAATADAVAVVCVVASVLASFAGEIWLAVFTSARAPSEDPAAAIAGAEPGATSKGTVVQIKAVAANDGAAAGPRPSGGLALVKYLWRTRPLLPRYSAEGKLIVDGHWCRRLYMNYREETWWFGAVITLRQYALVVAVALGSVGFAPMTVNAPAFGVQILFLTLVEAMEPFKSPGQQLEALVLASLDAWIIAAVQGATWCDHVFWVGYLVVPLLFVTFWTHTLISAPAASRVLDLVASLLPQRGRRGVFLRVSGTSFVVNFGIFVGIGPAVLCGYPLLGWQTILTIISGLLSVGSAVATIVNVRSFSNKRKRYPRGVLRGPPSHEPLQVGVKYDFELEVDPDVNPDEGALARVQLVSAFAENRRTRVRTQGTIAPDALSEDGSWEHRFSVTFDAAGDYTVRAACEHLPDENEAALVAVSSVRTETRVTRRVGCCPKIPFWPFSRPREWVEVLKEDMVEEAKGPSGALTCGKMKVKVVAPEPVSVPKLSLRPQSCHEGSGPVTCALLVAAQGAVPIQVSVDSFDATVGLSEREQLTCLRPKATSCECPLGLCRCVLALPKRETSALTLEPEASLDYREGTHGPASFLLPPKRRLFHLTLPLYLTPARTHFWSSLRVQGRTVAKGPAYGSLPLDDDDCSEWSNLAVDFPSVCAALDASFRQDLRRPLSELAFRLQLMLRLPEWMKAIAAGSWIASVDTLPLPCTVADPVPVDEETHVRVKTTNAPAQELMLTLISCVDVQETPLPMHAAVRASRLQPHLATAVRAHVRAEPPERLCVACGKGGAVEHGCGFRRTTTDSLLVPVVSTLGVTPVVVADDRDNESTGVWVTLKWDRFVALGDEVPVSVSVRRVQGSTAGAEQSESEVVLAPAVSPMQTERTFVPLNTDVEWTVAPLGAFLSVRTVARLRAWSLPAVQITKEPGAGADLAFEVRWTLPPDWPTQSSERIVLQSKFLHSARDGVSSVTSQSISHGATSSTVVVPNADLLSSTLILSARLVTSVVRGPWCSEKFAGQRAVCHFKTPVGTSTHKFYCDAGECRVQRFELEVGTLPHDTDATASATAGDGAAGASADTPASATEAAPPSVEGSAPAAAESQSDAERGAVSEPERVAEGSAVTDASETERVADPAVAAAGSDEGEGRTWERVACSAPSTQRKYDRYFHGSGNVPAAPGTEYVVRVRAVIVSEGAEITTAWAYTPSIVIPAVVTVAPIRAGAGQGLEVDFRASCGKHRVRLFHLELRGSDGSTVGEPLADVVPTDNAGTVWLPPSPGWLRLAVRATLVNVNLYGVPEVTVLAQSDRFLFPQVSSERRQTVSRRSSHTWPVIGLARTSGLEANMCSLAVTPGLSVKCLGSHSKGSTRLALVAILSADASDDAVITAAFKSGGEGGDGIRSLENGEGATEASVGGDDSRSAGGDTVLVQPLMVLWRSSLEPQVVDWPRNGLPASMPCGREWAFALVWQVFGDPDNYKETGYRVAWGDRPVDCRTLPVTLEHPVLTDADVVGDSRVTVRWEHHGEVVDPWLGKRSKRFKPQLEFRRYSKDNEEYTWEVASFGTVTVQAEPDGWHAVLPLSAAREWRVSVHVTWDIPSGLANDCLLHDAYVGLWSDHIEFSNLPDADIVGRAEGPPLATARLLVECSDMRPEETSISRVDLRWKRRLPDGSFSAESSVVKPQSHFGLWPADFSHGMSQRGATARGGRKAFVSVEAPNLELDATYHARAQFQSDTGPASNWSPWYEFQTARAILPIEAEQVAVRSAHGCKCGCIDLTVQVHRVPKPLVLDSIRLVVRRRVGAECASAVSTLPLDRKQLPFVAEPSASASLVVAVHWARDRRNFRLRLSGLDPSEDAAYEVGLLPQGDGLAECVEELVVPLAPLRPPTPSGPRVAPPSGLEAKLTTAAGGQPCLVLLQSDQSVPRTHFRVFQTIDGGSVDNGYTHGEIRNGEEVQRPLHKQCTSARVEAAVVGVCEHDTLSDKFVTVVEVQPQSASSASTGPPVAGLDRDATPGEDRDAVAGGDRAGPTAPADSDVGTGTGRSAPGSASASAALEPPSATADTVEPNAANNPSVSSAEEAAAIRIQARARGAADRQRVAGIRAGAVGDRDIPTEPDTPDQQAATGSSAEEAAAVRIQARARGAADRQRVAGIKAGAVARDTLDATGSPVSPVEHSTRAAPLYTAEHALVEDTDTASVAPSAPASTAPSSEDLPASNADEPSAVPPAAPAPAAVSSDAPSDAPSPTPAPAPDILSDTPPALPPAPAAVSSDLPSHAPSPAPAVAPATVSSEAAFTSQTPAATHTDRASKAPIPRLQALPNVPHLSSALSHQHSSRTAVPATPTTPARLNLRILPQPRPQNPLATSPEPAVVAPPLAAEEAEAPLGWLPGQPEPF